MKSVVNTDLSSSKSRAWHINNMVEKGGPNWCKPSHTSSSLTILGCRTIFIIDISLLIWNGNQHKEDTKITEIQWSENMRQGRRHHASIKKLKSLHTIFLLVTCALVSSSYLWYPCIQVFYESANRRGSSSNIKEPWETIATSKEEDEQEETTETKFI